MDVLLPGVGGISLDPRDAERLYRWHFAAVEFFPDNIDAVLSNALSLGTFLALPAASSAGQWDIEAFIASPPASWAVLSVWNSMDAFRLEVRGAPRAMRAAAGATRLVDRAAPWLGIPSIPNLFAPFGLYFLYGLGGAGPSAPQLVRTLCRHAYNMARRGGCGVVATEVGAREPVRAGVPHWARLGAEGLWCIKRLVDGYSHGTLGDWTKAPPGRSIFVDPRAMQAVVGAALLVVLYARLVRRVFWTVRRWWHSWQRPRRLLLITLTGGGSSPANDSFGSFTTYDNFYHTFSPYGLDDTAIKSLPSAQFLEATRASAGARDCVMCLLEFADGLMLCGARTPSSPTASTSHVWLCSVA